MGCEFFCVEGWDWVFCVGLFGLCCVKVLGMALGLIPFSAIWFL